MLPDLAEVLCLRVLFFLEERELCQATSSSRQLLGFHADGALWRHLALKRDPRLGERALDLLLSRWRVPERRPEEWRAACRQLSAAALPIWPGDAAASGAASRYASAARERRAAARWDDLERGAEQMPQEPNPSVFGRSTLWAGQSPHLFRLAPDLLLAVAGGYYSEVIGGAACQPLHDVALIELGVRAEGSQQRVRITTLIEGQGSLERMRAADALRRNGEEPDYRGPLHTHGAASDLDAATCRAFFFGGGAPQGQLTDEASALVIGLGRAEITESGTSEAPEPPLQAHWERIHTEGEAPSARQGVRGVVFEGRFIIFGGREQGGVCLNDVWELDVSEDLAGARMWHLLACEGRPPSPRVWSSSCHAEYGKWFIIGGGEWQFTPPADGHDFCRLYILDLRRRQWSALAGSGPEPGLGAVPAAMAASLVSLGGLQLAYLGGTMPHMIGPEGVFFDWSRHSSWREWYVRMDRPMVFDRKTQQWSSRRVCLGTAGSETIGPRAAPEQRVSEILLRSHFAAVHMPERGSVIVLGGSRYLCGEYFHDLLELRMDPTSATHECAATTADRTLQAEAEAEGVVGALPPAFPVFIRPFRDGSRLTRGLRGRFRGMLRDGHIGLLEYRRMLEEG
mmetsp:Transcript_101601/g.284861  ORF Transcript_101601/g.284861 Transcript_101601/m.284861 type:complete len:626 (+) Transcript_101601:179-2056(+)